MTIYITSDDKQFTDLDRAVIHQSIIDFYSGEFGYIEYIEESVAV